MAAFEGPGAEGGEGHRRLVTVDDTYIHPVPTSYVSYEVPQPEGAGPRTRLVTGHSGTDGLGLYNTVNVWDRDTLDHLRTFDGAEAQDEVYAAGITHMALYHEPVGGQARLVVAMFLEDMLKAVTVFDPEEGRVVRTLVNPGQITSAMCAYYLSGRGGEERGPPRLAFALENGEGPERGVAVWDPEAGTLVARLQGEDAVHDGAIHGLASFEPSWGEARALVAAASYAGVIELWEPETGTMERRYQRGREGLWCLAVYKERGGRDRIVTGGLQRIEVLDAETGELVAELAGHASPVMALHGEAVCRPSAPCDHLYHALVA
jgi:hypothetical protein